MVYQQSDYHTMHSKRENTCLALLVLVGFKGLLRTSTSTSAVVCHFTLKRLGVGYDLCKSRNCGFLVARSIYSSIDNWGAGYHNLVFLVFFVVFWFLGFVSWPSFLNLSSLHLLMFAAFPCHHVQRLVIKPCKVDGMIVQLLYN